MTQTASEFLRHQLSGGDWVLKSEVMSQAWAAGYTDPAITKAKTVLGVETSGWRPACWRLPHPEPVEPEKPALPAQLRAANHLLSVLARARRKGGRVDPVQVLLEIAAPLLSQLQDDVGLDREQLVDILGNWMRVIGYE